MNAIEYLQELQGIVEDVNAILASCYISERVGLADLTITEKTVSDLVKQNPALSNALTESLWPSITNSEVYHYTSRDAAEDILNSGKFRFTNIEKRYNEGEIKTFCETHKLAAYLEIDAGGNPAYRQLLMPNIFCASFTDTGLTESEEEYFWQNFASCGGVRLKISIIASNPNFRKIRYEPIPNQPIQILQQLTETIRTKYQRDFALQGVSRLCAFYLSGQDYGKEKEYRALYRTCKGFGPQPLGSGPDSYIELPLGHMSECGYQIDIIELCSDNRPQMSGAYAYAKRGA